MTLSRRDAIKYTALAGGVALGLPFVDTVQAAAPPACPSGPKRFIFFLMSNGFHPSHVRPRKLADTGKTDKLIDVDLTKHELPHWSAPLEKYKDRLTILHGVNGQHCDTSHGSPFGCLAGVKEASSPRAQTIDHALAQMLPVAPLPMLGIGLSNLRAMQGQAIAYTSSAAGAGKPVPMFCDPRMLYQSVFGGVVGGKTQEAFIAETAWYDQLIERSAHKRARLAGDEAAKFDTYIEGLRETKKQREALMARKETLNKFKPEYTAAFDNPRQSGDWWAACIDVGMAALRAGATNVLTIDAGLSGPDGMPMDTLDELHKAAGKGKGRKPSSSHDLGHWGQTDPYWLTTRLYSWHLLERIIKPLAETPEPGGKGTMLDNTLIVYTSDAGEVQHSHGIHWPFVLIGNLGGRIRTGRYIQYPTWGSDTKTPNSSFDAPAAYRKRPRAGRTINALWAALLHAAGKQVDGFNLDTAPPGIDRPGPLAEILA